MHHGTAVLALQSVDRLGDRQLLERFARERDEAAFAALVRRHGSAVLRACRRVLRDGHAAEDAFQATFLVLARRAEEVAWRDSVRGWLCGVAYRQSRHAASAAGRRREVLTASCEREAGEESGVVEQAVEDDPLAALTRQELRRIMADELHRLPAKYREPIVLCYLEGKTNEEAARQLGWAAGSMSRRLARARELLREGLTRRGLALVVLIACGAFAALRFSEHGPTPVAKLMQPFKASPAGGEGLENALQRLAAGDRLEDAYTKQLARRTAAIAGLLEQHAPAHDPLLWHALSQALGEAANDLSTAVVARDEASTLAAAGRLTAICQSCHAIYRQ